MKAFTIGRHEKNDFIIKNETVGGTHAEILISDDFKTFVLKDLESTNSTRVNGRKIMTKTLKKGDMLQFGSALVDSSDLFVQLERYVFKNRHDFRKEFQELRKVEGEYKDKRLRTNKYYKLRAMVPRIAITLAIISLLSFMKTENSIRYTLMVGASILGTALSTLSVSEKRKIEILEDLKVEFQLVFVCPKCKIELYRNEWKYWEKKKKCGNKECGCTFV